MAVLGCVCITPITSCYAAWADSGLSVSASLTKVANEYAFILRMIFSRCIGTVHSVIPSSATICFQPALNKEWKDLLLAPRKRTIAREEV